MDIHCPGVPVPSEDLKRVCALLARAPMETAFPGAQPVSLTRDDLPSLREGFVVCEKSDGVRYLLLVWKSKVYFVDRQYRIFDAGIRSDATNGSLLDGELVIENDGRAVFLIFDALCVCKTFTGNLSLQNRLRVVCADFLFFLSRAPPVFFMLKKMYAFSDTLNVWRTMVPLLRHGNDGLIFTRDAAPYKQGTCRDILKWKPRELNSVDFCVEVVDGRYAKLLWGCNGSLEAANLPFAPTQREELAEFFPRPIIIECVWANGSFCFHRVRRDRDTPNDKSTVEGVLRSIRDNVTINDFC